MNKYKFYTVYCLIFACYLIGILDAQAQHSDVKMLEQKLSHLDAEQIIKIYATAIEMSESPEDAKKKTIKLFKKMEAKQQQAILKQVDQVSRIYGTDIEVKGNDKLTTITFEENEVDFGDLRQGESVSYTFRFTNTGDYPLFISLAKSTCGCTVPEWPKEAIAPGDSGELLVKYNSTGKKGMQMKKINITANTQPIHTQLYIKANVLVE